jgi:hypothetical protein
LPENAVAEDDGPGRSRRRGLPTEDWHKIGTALATAATSWADTDAADLWIAAIGRRLELDPLERRILELALHYRLDQRVERLCDALSECRDRPMRFMRNANLTRSFWLRHVPRSLPG